MMQESILSGSVTALMEKASTVLPGDVRDALSCAHSREPEGSIARETLGLILQSAELSRESGLPICQDTGVPLVMVRAVPEGSMSVVEAAVRAALRSLTERGILRQNCVDPVTGRDTSDNTGDHVPQIHFLPSRGPTLIQVMFKGGGSENVSAQYSLPDPGLDAGRDLEGVRKCVLDAVFRAQGKGCSPGILGICIGGDRASGYLLAKEALFRRLDLRNESPDLDRLEKTIVEQANELGIGPMGLGGATTLLGARIVSAGRHPACYFVTVSYSCWVTRRASAELDREGRIVRWL
ncbi:MAG: fumarate hydratase [Desulfomonilia bacterium]